METRDFLKYFVRGCRYCVNVCEIFSCYRYSHCCFFTDKIYKEKKIKQPLTVYSPTALLCFPITKLQNLKLYFPNFSFFSLFSNYVLALILSDRNLNNFVWNTFWSSNEHPLSKYKTFICLERFKNTFGQLNLIVN